MQNEDKVKQENEMFCKKLKSILKDESDISIIQILTMRINSYSFSGIDSLIDEIRKRKLKKQFFILISCLFMELGYKWAKEEWEAKKHNDTNPHWDDRNKASKQFAYYNFDIFREIFKQNAGFELIKPMHEIKENLKYDSIFEYEINVGYRSTLRSELSAFRNMHPTLQQRTANRFLKFLNEENMLVEESKYINFPMI